MNSKIDFAKLTLQDALDVAILIEEEARDRYESFADQIGSRYDGDAGDFFSFMLINEEKHAAELREKRKKLFGNSESKITPEMVWDVEAPDPSGPRPFMSPQQAFQLAIAAEKKAYAFFDIALQFVKDNEVKALFTELRNEEKYHQQMLEEKLATLPKHSGPDFDDDGADEPPAL